MKITNAILEEMPGHSVVLAIPCEFKSGQGNFTNCTSGIIVGFLNKIIRITTRKVSTFTFILNYSASKTKKSMKIGISG